MLEKQVQQRRQDIKQGKPGWGMGPLQGLEAPQREQDTVLGVGRVSHPEEMLVWGLLEWNPGTTAENGWILQSAESTISSQNGQPEA